MENKPFEFNREHVKKIGTIVVFSIILPLVDVFTDLHLIIKLYSSDLPRFASLLLGDIIHILTNITRTEGPLNLPQVILA